MDFSFVTLADLDNLVEKIIKKSKAKIVFQKKEQNF
jgi:shikimate kinase